MKNTEREFKWEATPRDAFERFQCVLERVAKLSRWHLLKITDYYLDNDSHDFTRQKIALRIRRTGSVFEATCKTRSTLKQGLATRQEITLVLPKVRSLRSAIKQLALRGTWQGYSLQGLKVKFRICNDRKVCKVQTNGCICEVALDDYVTFASGHQWRRKEIELELKTGSAKEFKKLAANLSKQSALAAAQVSKVAGAEKWIKNKFWRN